MQIGRILQFMQLPSKVQFRRAAIGVFAAFHIGAVCYANLPPGPLYPANPQLASKIEALRDLELRLVGLRGFLKHSFPIVTRGVEKYLFFFGLDQHWTMFAPAPPHHVVYHSIIAVRDDETTRALWEWVPGQTSDYNFYDRFQVELIASHSPPTHMFLFLRYYARVFERLEGTPPKAMVLLESSAKVPVRPPLSQWLRTYRICSVPREATIEQGVSHE